MGEREGERGGTEREGREREIERGEMERERKTERGERGNERKRKREREKGGERCLFLTTVLTPVL